MDTDKYLLKDGIVYEKNPKTDNGCSDCDLICGLFTRLSCGDVVYKKVGKLLNGTPEVGKWYKWIGSEQDKDDCYMNDYMSVVLDGKPRRCIITRCPVSGMVGSRCRYLFAGMKPGLGIGWLWADECFAEVPAPESETKEEPNKQDPYKYGYKIDLSGVPEDFRGVVSEIVQRHAFELGYRRSAGEDTVQYTGAPYLFFDKSGMHITYSNSFPTYTHRYEGEISVSQFLALKKEDVPTTKLFSDFSWLHGAARSVLVAAAVKNLIRMGYNGSFGHGPNYLTIDKEAKTVLPRTSVPSIYTEVSVNDVLEGRI